MAVQNKRAIRAEDLYDIQLIKEFTLSPDKKSLVYALEGYSKKTDKKWSNLYLMPSKGGKAIALTSGTKYNSMPKWSPDGKRLAFLSNRKEGKMQIHLLRMTEPGEAYELGDLKASIASIGWSSDSKELLLQCMLEDKESEKEKRN